MATKKRKKVELPTPSQEELDQKAKAEEFWSDPCWTEPLETVDDMDRMQIAAHMSKL